MHRDNNNYVLVGEEPEEGRAVEETGAMVYRQRKNEYAAREEGRYSPHTYKPIYVKPGITRSGQLCTVVCAPSSVYVHAFVSARGSLIGDRG